MRINALLILLLTALNVTGAEGVKNKPVDAAKVSTSAPVILWRAPENIKSRDLFYGSGGKQHEPSGVFTFVKEDDGGTTPKFVVTDRHGVKWKVKMGVEAKPETAASRLVWAVGYDTDDDYFVRKLDVRDMPAKLHRGQELRSPDGTVRNVCLERDGANGKKIGVWKWRHNPFTGSRELNGLRVLMAVINNWDLKDQNTATYDDGKIHTYEIGDLGATLGAPRRSWPASKGKGNLEAYQDSRFIRKVTADSVDFQVPARPALIYLINPKEYVQRIRMGWIGKDIPRADVRWMAGWLARLSPKQIRDAFRAAGYSPQETEEFASVVERRIAALREL